MQFGHYVHHDKSKTFPSNLRGARFVIATSSFSDKKAGITIKAKVKSKFGIK